MLPPVLAIGTQVVQYLYYKLRYTNHPSNTPLPQFKIEPEIALELLMERLSDARLIFLF